MRIGGAHRFDLASARFKLFQCADAKQLFALPERIEADLRLLQPRPIEREDVPWRRVGVHAFEVAGEQRLHAFIAEVFGLDDAHRSGLFVYRLNCAYGHLCASFDQDALSTFSSCLSFCRSPIAISTSPDSSRTCACGLNCMVPFWRRTASAITP